jgi:hypothetical protein
MGRCCDFDQLHSGDFRSAKLVDQGQRAKI